MHNDAKKGKEELSNAIIDLQNMHSRRPNSFLMRVFFDAKSDEVAQVFSGGPSVNMAKVVDVLNQIAPLYTAKWSTIKF
jgi:hypothetical protein